jgi:hypothetical protein
MVLFSRRPLIGLLAALVLLALGSLGASALLASTAAQPPDPTDRCRNGGFANYIDPSTGQPFRNQGECISFVTQGGTLSPTMPPASLPDLAITMTCRDDTPVSTHCLAIIQNASSVPATIPAYTVPLRATLTVSGGTITSESNNIPFGLDQGVHSVASFPCTGVSTCTIAIVTLSPVPLTPGQAFQFAVTIGFSSGSTAVTNTTEVDPANAITESNENNNSATATYTIRP